MKKLSLLLVLFLFLSMITGCGQSAAPDTDTGDAKDNIATAEAFLNHILAKEFDAAREEFDETMSAQVDAKKLEELWTALINQVGAFKEHTDSREEKNDEYQMVYLTCNFEKQSLDIRVVFDDDGNIAGFQYVPVGEGK